MAWNYHDDDVPGPDAAVHLSVVGIPNGASRARLEHYRIDREHSNSYTVWEEMGSPQDPVDGGRVELEFSLPRQGVSLVQVSWR